MNRRDAWRWLVAGVAGLALAMSLRLYLQREARRLALPHQTAVVLRARKSVPAGKWLTADMVEAVPLPLAYVEPNALSGVSELVDAARAPRWRVARALVKGEQLTHQRLLPRESQVGLSWALPDDQTAVTLRLSPEQAVAGLIQPGDWVHVVWLPDKSATRGDPHARLLLPHAHVAAVGTRFLGMMENPDEIASKSMAPEEILITFVLSPQQSEDLLLAASTGRVVLALISPANDAEDMDERGSALSKMIERG